MKRLCLLLVPFLAGCSAPAIVGLVGDLTSGGNDYDVALARSELAHTWVVQAYTGTEIGAVMVPAAAEMRCVFEADGTYRITSKSAVSIGGERGWVYDEAGTWEVVDAKNHGLRLTPTRRGGVAVTGQAAVSGSYFLESGQLVLTTSVVGPGSVRYVMQL